jgi:hypothetical protein
MGTKALLQAAPDAAQGHFHADLGGGVFKQRVARSGAKKSGGYRSILCFKAGWHTFFDDGFAKSERGNVSAKELRALKKLADELLGYSAVKIASAEAAGALIEMVDEDDNEEEDGGAQVQDTGYRAQNGEGPSCRSCHGTSYDA